MFTSQQNSTAHTRGRPPTADRVIGELMQENQFLRQQIADLTRIIQNLTFNQTASPQTTTTVPQSPLFTRKAILEHKQIEIITALQRSYADRTDKARALVTELRRWHTDGYLDLNYNATVIHNELQKLIAIPFGIPGFRKYFNGYKPRPVT